MFGIVEPEKIYIFYGKMGAGKTVNAIRQVFAFHKRGQPVWLNFPLVKYPPIKKNTKHAPIYREDDPAGILSMEGGLYVIDEAYMTLNSREWQNLPKQVFTAMTHVRKTGMTVIIIAQSWMRIDKSIREVASYAREFRGGSLFGRVYNYHEYEVDELGDIIKHEPVEYESRHAGVSLVSGKIYNAYDTNYLFAGHAAPRKHWRSAIPEGSPGEGGPGPRALRARPLPLKESGGSPVRGVIPILEPGVIPSRGGLDPVWPW